MFLVTNENMGLCLYIHFSLFVFVKQVKKFQNKNWFIHSSLSGGMQKGRGEKPLSDFDSKTVQISIRLNNLIAGQKTKRTKQNVCKKSQLLKLYFLYFWGFFLIKINWCIRPTCLRVRTNCFPVGRRETKKPALKVSLLQG